ncbi:hypothetical protein [Agromyces endophyticus]|nr:hypothetical protein [Agromyces sp. H17E-10]
MSDTVEREPDAPAAAPFAMIAGDPQAMVCEGDVCFVPGAIAE